MKLEQICVSLELAKQLKEAGYPQDSFFWWTGKEDFFQIRCSEKLMHETSGISISLGENISAPTVSEILEKLPRFMNRNGKFHWSISPEEIKKTQFIDGKELVEKKVVDIFSMRYPYHAIVIEGETFVETLAKMWIYLKGSDLLK